MVGSSLHAQVYPVDLTCGRAVAAVEIAKVSDELVPADSCEHPRHSALEAFLPAHIVLARSPSARGHNTEPRLRWQTSMPPQSGTLPAGTEVQLAGVGIVEVWRRRLGAAHLERMSGHWVELCCPVHAVTSQVHHSSALVQVFLTGTDHLP